MQQKYTHNSRNWVFIKSNKSRMKNTENLLIQIDDNVKNDTSNTE